MLGKERPWRPSGTGPRVRPHPVKGRDMDSVSADHGVTEDLGSEPLLGVVPARMNWFHTWDDRSEIIGLYLDRSRGDGCLVLARRHVPEENACTFSWEGDQVKDIVWRGAAADRPRAWRELQRERVQRFLMGD